MASLSIAKVRYHEDCQSRVRLDEETVTEYAHRMREGAEFPAIIVFFDGSEHWLADGYHRFAAAKAVAREVGDEAADIPADVRQGTRLDAVRHALAANAQHGKRREPGDYRKGYQIAVRCELCEPTDTAAVRDLLACSERWARDLTAAARDVAERERNARILEARLAGERQAAIAAREGISERQLRRIEDRTERQTADMSGPSEYKERPSAVSHEPAPCQPTHNSADAAVSPVANTIRETPAPEPDPIRREVPLPVAQPEPVRVPPPIPEAIARLSDPGSIHWSDMMTRIGDVIAAMRRATPHGCPAVMAAKAASLIEQLENSIASIKEGLPHDHAL
jgi:hypothetical protein